jgi:cytochrome c biogenesis protein CcmG, thiol:disulfide interchange protein DsbE
VTTPLTDGARADGRHTDGPHADGAQTDGGRVTPSVASSVPPGHGPVPALPDPQPRVRHTARWVALGVLVIAAGLVAVLATRPPASVSEVSSPLVGKVAPAVTGVTVKGARFALPRAPGHFVVVNFFASWCVPCQTEGPALVQFEFEHQRAGDASMVSVVFTDTAGAAARYQSQLGATWPTLSDPGGELALRFGVRAPPSTFVIAPDGRVVAFIVAPVTAADLDGIIAEAKATHA